MKEAQCLDVERNPFTVYCETPNLYIGFLFFDFNVITCLRFDSGH